MKAAHHTAALARVRAHAKLTDKTFDGIRIDNGAPVRANYVAVTTSLPGFERTRNTAEQTPEGDALLLIRARVVATTYDGMLQLQDALDAQLVGHRLVVAGRSTTGFEAYADGEQFDPVTSLWHVDVTYEATSSRV